AESTSSESTEMESPPPVEASAPADETLTEVAEETAPDMPAEDPAEPAEAKPKLNVGMGIRVGTALVFDDPAADGPALRLHDGVGSQLNVRPYFSGQLTEAVGFTGNLEINERSEEHTSELQSRENLVCRLLL